MDAEDIQALFPDGRSRRSNTYKWALVIFGGINVGVITVFLRTEKDAISAGRNLRSTNPNIDFVVGAVNAEGSRK